MLEHQDELAKLQRLFTDRVFYKNPRIKSEEESEALRLLRNQKRMAHEERAANLVSSWTGSDKEKTEQVMFMLELEMEKCREFIAEVFKPVSPPHAEQSSWADEVLPDFGSTAQESLVVGIKFHRGHLNGITQGDDVELVREPDNAYDPNAIQVKLQNGEVLGYLTKEFAAVLAEQMDAGSIFKAEVSRIVRDKIYILFQ